MVDKIEVHTTLKEIVLDGKYELDATSISFLADLYTDFRNNSWISKNPILEKELADKEENISRRLNLYRMAGNIALVKAVVLENEDYLILAEQCFEQGIIFSGEKGLYDTQNFFSKDKNKIYLYFEALLDLNSEFEVNDSDLKTQLSKKNKSDDYSEDTILDIINKFPDTPERKLSANFLKREEKELRVVCEVIGQDYSTVVQNSRLAHYMPLS